VTSVSKPRLRAISPEATPDEVAAIVAAVAEIERRNLRETALHAPARSQWVTANRLTSRRAGATRGLWKLSGRLGRRARV